MNLSISSLPLSLAKEGHSMKLDLLNAIVDDAIGLDGKIIID